MSADSAILKQYALAPPAETKPVTTGIQNVADIETNAEEEPPVCTNMRNPTIVIR